jgi:hypothetical protein
VTLIDLPAARSRGVGHRSGHSGGQRLRAAASARRWRAASSAVICPGLAAADLGDVGQHSDTTERRSTATWGSGLHRRGRRQTPPSGWPPASARRNGELTDVGGIAGPVPRRADRAGLSARPCTRCWPRGSARTPANPDRAGPCDRKLGAASLMGQRLTNQVIAALFRLRRGG